jgi:hypothetical protein
MMSKPGNDAGQESELSKAAREALTLAALAAVALVIAVNIPVPMWARILICFSVLFVAVIVGRARKVRRSN